MVMYYFSLLKSPNNKHGKNDNITKINLMYKL